MNRPLVPGHIVIDDFLADEAVARLDAHIAAQETQLREISIDFENNQYSGSRRLWQAPDGLGPCEEEFTSAVSVRMEELFTATGIKPFVPACFEFELNAQFDGCFFEQHIDSDFGEAAKHRATDRVVSAVYYFPRHDAEFSGGELELYAFNSALPTVFIAPKRNRLVAFPSFANHRVARVTASDNGLANARLSVNCWIHKARPPAVPITDI